MKQSYEDITRRISEPPKWYDEHGAPRYNAFRPHDLANPYAYEAACLRGRCQVCHTRFVVAASRDRGQTYLFGGFQVGDGWSFGYGDPPYHGCNGDSMLMIVMEVKEYWRYEGGWHRDVSAERRYLSGAGPDPE